VMGESYTQDGPWSRNGLVFATKQEAEENARDLMMRWMMVEDSRAAEVDEPVNYQYVDRKLVHIPEGE